MKKQLLFLALLFLPFMKMSAQNLTSCVKMSNFKQGKECSTSNGYSYTIENVCLVTIEVKYCLQKTIGKWQILTSVLLPGDKKTIYVCEGIGKYNYWARKYQGDDVKFPTNDEINEMD